MNRLQQKNKIILGIETSCDETAAAVVLNGNKVLSNIISSQIEQHKIFGGVIPEIAARSHLEQIDKVVREAIAVAGVTVEKLDGIAVTRGPGLVGALLIGVSYAKAMAFTSGIRLIPVNHIHAHIHGAFLGVDLEKEDIFPCLALVVSGGHTNLYFMETTTSYRLLGHSLDDACGECFDKVAKILGFEYPGGPKIEACAQLSDHRDLPLMPKIMRKSGYDFSYSGLKTHMNILLSAQPEFKTNQLLKSRAAEAFQAVAFEPIIHRFKRALKEFKSTKSIVVAGGVSANQFLRTQLLEVSQKFKVKLLSPPLQYCSDNAAMIAACGYYHMMSDEKLHANTLEKFDWEPLSTYSSDY